MAIRANGAEGDREHAGGPQADRGAIWTIASSSKCHRSGVHVRFSYLLAYLV